MPKSLPKTDHAYGPYSAYRGKTNATRIDHLHALDKVILELARGGTSAAVFLGIEGEGEDRIAKFMSACDTGTYVWEIYRMDGRWRWGSSADPVKLLEVLA